MADTDVTLTQPSFTAGEVSPELYARKDLAKYQVGARKLLNCTVAPHGGVSNRAGLRFAAEVKDHSKINRLTLFEAASDEAFILVWGDKNVRPMYRGAYLDNGGNPYEIATPYLDTELAAVYSEQSNDVATLVHPNYPVRELGRYDVLDWRLSTVTFQSSVPAPTGTTAVGTQGYTGYGSDKNPEKFVYKVSAIGSSGEESLPSNEDESDIALVLGYDKNFVTITWDPVGIVQQGRDVPNGPIGWAGETSFDRSFTLTNNGTITHVGIWSSSARTATQLYVKIAERVSATDYTVLVNEGVDHPGGGWHYHELASPFVVPATGSHHAGMFANPAVEETDNIAQGWRISYNAPLGAVTGFVDAVGSQASIRVRYQAADEDVVDRYLVYKEQNGLFGYIGETPDTTFKDTNFLPSFANGPQTGANPFEGEGNYPSVVTFVQQRRVFGNSINRPQTIWETQAGNYNNMGVAQPIKDSDAIEFTLASRKKQDIYHIVPLEKGMIVFTRSGEWRVTGRDGDVITPSSILPLPQSSYGAHQRIKPLVIGEQLLFVPRSGRRVYEMEYSLQVDRYKANTLSVLAEHLFKGREVVAWDYASDPDGIVWAVMSDGKAISLTYLKEHDVWGFGRAETRGKFLDVCVCPEGTRDVPYFLISRRIGGVVKQYIEYLASRSFTDVRDAFFVDSGLSLDAPVTIASIAIGATTTVTKIAHGLVDGDVVELAGVQLYDDDDMPTISLDGRWIVAGATANTYRLTYEYDNDEIDVVAGGDLNTSASVGNYLGAGGVYRRCFATVNGLGHLEGRSVTALCDGSVVDDAVIAGGAVTFDRKYARVHIGLPYRAVLGTLDLVNSQGDDTGVTKGVPEVFLRVLNTRGIKIGRTEEDATDEFYPREDENYGEPNAMMSGLKRADLWSEWNIDQQLYVVQDQPLPMTILGVTLGQDYSGK